MVLLSADPNKHIAQTYPNNAQQHHVEKGLQLKEKALLSNHQSNTNSQSPGINANNDGIKCCSRTLMLEQQNTCEELTQRISAAWGNLQELCRVLCALTPITYRLKLFTSCIAQSLPWSTESLHITHARLQRVRVLKSEFSKP